jgi:hypothetical protein
VEIVLNSTVSIILNGDGKHMYSQRLTREYMCLYIYIYI